MSHRFLNRLEYVRKRSGYSQKRVAALLGLKQAMISHLERGSELPRLPTAFSLEALYGTPIAYLYPDLYRQMRDRVREEESQLTGAAGRHRTAPDYTRAHHEIRHH
jgi:transcriptional regulator with XRE-family HTH domain